MAKKKRRRKPATITRAEALRRIEIMTKNAHDDVREALYAYVVMNVANDRVGELRGAHVAAANIYAVVHRGLMVNAAVSLMRLFDLGSKRFPRNRREISSLPLLIKLLAQKRCRSALAANAEDWLANRVLADQNRADCLRHIDDALKAYALLQRMNGAKILAAVNHFRNHAVAHRKIEVPDKRGPTYGNIFLLLMFAQAIVKCTQFAVFGQNIDFAERRGMLKEDAREFWTNALRVDAEDTADQT